MEDAVVSRRPARHRRPGQVLDQVEAEYRVEHGDLDPLPFTGGHPVNQRGEHRVGDGQAGDLVANDVLQAPEAA